jgi:cell division protein FtsZ
MKGILENASRYTQTNNFEETAAELEGIGHARIICAGCGGAGNNTINRLSMLGGVMGAETIALNTDRQHLENIQADKKFVIGKELTKGLGAGGDPSVGWEAAQEDRHKLKDLFKDANLVFVSAGMGGGTGTGSAPVVAEVAKECGALVVGVVTLPFRMEGSHRFEKAIQGLEAFRRYADTVITLDNNKLLQLVPNMPIDYAFSVSDEVLAEMVKGITETITQPSLVNLDYADVRTIMQDGGVAVIGVGESNTKNRVEEAVHEAMTCKLLDVDYKNAKGALVHVSGGSNMTLNEANRVGEIVNSIMDPEAKIIWGARVDEGLKDSMRVMLIMTGVKSPFISGRAADGDIELQPFERDARRKKMGGSEGFGRSIDWAKYGIDDLFS